jgi:hypothetical protein
MQTGSSRGSYEFAHPSAFDALVTRHLPSLLHHRGSVAAGLVLLGLAKLVAAAAMWEGQEWGGYLLAATVALLLPLDLRQAVVSPTPGHVLLATANVAVLIACFCCSCVVGCRAGHWDASHPHTTVRPRDRAIMSRFPTVHRVVPSVVLAGQVG